MSWQNNIPSDITNAQLIERIIVYETFLSTIHGDIQNFSNLLNRYVKEGDQQILDSIKTSSEEIQMYVINNKPKLSFVSNVVKEKEEKNPSSIVRVLRSKKGQATIDLSSLTHFTQLALPQQVKLKQAAQSSLSFQRKDYILNEIITTEIDYINDLGVIVGYYEKPLQEEFKHILSEQNVSTIFRNIDAILDVHKELLTKLRIEQRKTENRDVGRVFIDMFESKLKGIYLLFNNNLTVADDCLMKCYKEPAFAEYAELVRLLPESRNQPLDMLLIKPFQRNNRYPILLKKLLDHTPEGPEKNSLQEAWSMLEREVKVKRNADTLAQTLELKNRFLILSAEDKELNHLHKHVFVDQIAVKEIDGKKLRKAQILLFKDIVIIAREKGKNLIRKFYSPLNLVTVKEVNSDNLKTKNVLELRSKLNQPVQVAFTTQLERNKWLQIITAHITK